MNITLYFSSDIAINFDLKVICLNVPIIAAILVFCLYIDSDSLNSGCHNHPIIFCLIKVWNLKIVLLEEKRILWVKEKRQENSANPRLGKSVLKAVCYKNVTDWRSEVKEKSKWYFRLMWFECYVKLFSLERRIF